MNDETFLYLITTGWKSGNPHKIEIWFVQKDDEYYILAETRYQAHWVQNIQHNPKIRFYIATRKQVDITEIAGIGRVIEDQDDPELANQVKSMMMKKYGWDNGLIVELATRSTL